MYQYKQLFIKIFLLLMFRKLQSRLQTFMSIRSTLLNDWLMQKHLHHHKNVNSLYSYNKVTENDPFLLEQPVCLPPKNSFQMTRGRLSFWSKLFCTKHQHSSRVGPLTVFPLWGAAPPPNKNCSSSTFACWTSTHGRHLAADLCSTSTKVKAA